MEFHLPEYPYGSMLNEDYAYDTMRDRRDAAVDAATADLFCFGTGVIFVPSDGSEPRHIPIREFYQPRLDPFTAWPFPKEEK